MKYVKPLMYATLIAGALTFSSGRAKGQDSSCTFPKDSISFVAPKKYANMKPLAEKSLDEVNRLLAEEKKTKKLEVVEIDTNFIGEGWYTAVYNPYPTPNILASSLLISDSLLARLSIFHEQSHAYYDFVVGDSTKQEIGLLFTEAMNHRFILPGRSDSVSFSAISELEADKFHPVFSLFDESNYTDKVSWDYGHPYDKHKYKGKDDVSELFVSAGCVLRFYPKEFLSRLNELSSSDEKGATIARKIASLVIGCWNGSGIFDQSLLSKITAISLKAEN